MSENNPDLQLIGQPHKLKRGVSPALLIGALLAVCVMGLACVAAVAGGTLALVTRTSTVTTPPAPALGTGDVQITLTWDAAVDLDLRVTDPAGETIHYFNAVSASGGRMDVGSVTCDGVANPVENVFWPYGSAPAGSYSVYVHYTQDCGINDPVNYTVTVRMDDEVLSTYTGTLKFPGQSDWATSFNRFGAPDCDRSIRSGADAFAR